MLKTSFGIVGLRKPRQKEKIHLQATNEDKEIYKGWLLKIASEDKDKYRKCVKQAMLIASTNIEMEDLDMPIADRASEGMMGAGADRDAKRRDPAYVQKQKTILTDKIKGMKQGTLQIPLRQLGGNKPIKLNMNQAGEYLLEKHLLKKKASRCKGCSLRTRFFCIDSGTLKVYKKKDDKAKVHCTYELQRSEVSCEYENRDEKKKQNPSGVEGRDWDKFDGTDNRVKLKVAERGEKNKSDLYLYGDTPQQAKMWARAIRQSKHLGSPDVVDTFKSVVGRISGNVIKKGWDALFKYAKEHMDTQKLVKSLAMRLMKTDLSRGWIKMKLVYQQERATQFRKREQIEWATRFIRDKMYQISHKGIEKLEDQQTSIITQVQHKFRQYRTDRIFHREYPLGSKARPRSQGPSPKTCDMGASFDSSTCENVLLMTLEQSSMDKYYEGKDVFTMKKAVYAEDPFPVAASHVNVSDSLTMLSFCERDEGAEHSNLAKADWAQYVNLDQISSVVLYSERMMNLSDDKHELLPSMARGAWFTINGPRLGWSRRIKKGFNIETHMDTFEAVGAPDGFEIPQKLTSCKKVRWFSIEVSIRDVNVPKVDEIPPDLEEEKKAGQDGEPKKEKAKPQGPWKTYMVVHILGRRFQSDPAEGVRANYPLSKYQNNILKMEVPIVNAECVAAMDMSEIGVDIVECNDDPRMERVVWAGKMPMWKVFAEDNHQRSALDKIEALGFRGHQADKESMKVVSLEETIKDKGGNDTKEPTIYLVHPEAAADQKYDAFVKLKVQVRIPKEGDQVVAPERLALSPELLGCGPVTSLYTAQRGAWFSPQLADRQRFMVDNVASFVELTLHFIRFPASDTQAADKLFKYKIDATCGGVTVSSPVLHRPKDGWEKVYMTLDPKQLVFKGAKIYLPILPGAWRESSAPEVEITLLQCEVPKNSADAVSYREMLERSGKPNPLSQRWEPTFKEVLPLGQELLVNVIQTNATINLPPVSSKPGGAADGADGTQVELTYDIGCRDRDFVRVGGTSCDCSTIVCVGDVATLATEERMCYPSDDREFRRRFPPTPGFMYKSAEKDKATQAGKWEAPLRDPCLSHELGQSGLDWKKQVLVIRDADEKEINGQYRRFAGGSKYKHSASGAVVEFQSGSWMVKKQDGGGTEYQKAGDIDIPPQGHWAKSNGDSKKKIIVERGSFEQRSIPKVCDDLIPHIFALPQTEREFNSEGRPGVYWRIIDDLKLNQPPADPKATGRSSAKDKKVVTSLTHTIKNVPVIVLAVYPNQTCDVEVSPPFLREWEKTPYKTYSLPGIIKVEAPKGKDGKSQADQPEKRVLCKEVPLSSVKGVHNAGFNIYDANITSSDEVVQSAQSSYRNGFNPRVVTEEGLHDVHIGKDVSKGGAYSVVGGPVPADAGAGCTYEWQLRLHAASVEDMLQFVTTLRQCVRMDHWQQMQKMSQCQAKQNAPRPVRYHMGSDKALSPSSGFLEIVLVEARGLRKKHLSKHKDWKEKLHAHSKEYFEVSPYASFRLRQVDNTKTVAGSGEEIEDLVYRGSAVQRSPIMKNTVNPKWCSLADCASSGGMLFKTPIVDPAAFTKTRTNPTPAKTLFFEIQVVNNTFESFSKMGQNVLGTTRRNAKDDPDPLRKNDEPTTSLCDLCRNDAPFNDFWLPLDSEDNVGEIHVMTRWVPNKQTASMKRQPTSARAWAMQMLRPKLAQSILREPIFELKMPKHGYNPNLVTAGPEMLPQTHADFMVKHAEELYNNERYLKCIAERTTGTWQDLQTKEEVLERVSPGFNPELPRYGLPPHRRMDDGSVAPTAAPGGKAADPSGNLCPPLWLVVTGAWGSCVAADSKGEGETYKSIVYTRGSDPQNPEPPGLRSMTDQTIQLQEDTVGAATWEGTLIPAMMDRHMKRISRAQRVCVALCYITKDRKELAGVNSVCSVSYCQSLFYIAFFLLLPQFTEKRGKGAVADAEVIRESRAFWLLHSLICSPDNGLLRDYFGGPEFNSVGAPAVRGNGPLEDILRLDCIIIRYEQEVWIHLRALGFQLSTVFYPCFMCLFAFALPTSSLFRMWDVLFSEKISGSQAPADPAVVEDFKPPRHTMLNLAFAIIQNCREKLMQCQSAIEARDCLLRFMGSMYDPAQLVESIYQAEHHLWEHEVYKISQFAAKLSGGAIESHSHTKDFKEISKWYATHLDQYVLQNKVLKEFIQFGKVEERAAAMADTRMTSQNVGAYVITKLQSQAVQGARTDPEVGYMFRPVPDKIVEYGPLISWQSGAFSFWEKMKEVAQPAAELFRHQAVMSPPPEKDDRGGKGEPVLSTGEQFTKADWQRWVKRGLEPGGKSTPWTTPHSPDSPGDFANRLYENFESFGQKRMSINELFLAMLCFSKGTVGEKALKLFYQYAFADVTLNYKQCRHVVPVSHHALSVLEKAEANQDKAMTQVLQPPEPANVGKETCLHFKIFTQDDRSRKGPGGPSEPFFGEVFVPTMKPFISGDLDTDNAPEQLFDIWKNKKPIGTAAMAIKWVPSGEAADQQFATGQLVVRLFYIKFQGNIDAPERKNPSMKMYTYYPDQGGGYTPTEIDRWDYREMRAKLVHNLTLTMAGQGAFTKTMTWQEQMHESILRDFHLHPHRSRANLDGLLMPDAKHKEVRWGWSDMWGRQYSTQNFRLRAEFCKVTQKANAISLRSCRLITQQLLNTSLVPVSSRQAICISDSTFGRSGMVAGILDGIITQEDKNDYPSIAALKEQYQAEKKTFVDCKRQVTRFFEISVERSMGRLKMWPADVQDIDLARMYIKDPFPDKRKTLWIRYCRAGDGERRWERISVSEDGKLQIENKDLSLDYPEPEKEKAGNQKHMTIAKEEFVACVLNSPLLSESLRKLTMWDSGDTVVPPSTAPTNTIGTAEPISLDVNITDSTDKAEDEELLDVFNIRQRVIFEVWDSDRMPSLKKGALGSLGMSDFLGEAWLPNLSTLRTNMTTHALVLGPAPDRDSGDVHRPDPRKNLDDKKENEITGELFVEASWEFPPPAGSSETDKWGAAKPAAAVGAASDKEGLEGLSARLEQEALQHTGLLKLKVLRGQSLRRGDGRKLSDPYVVAYIRNDCFSAAGEGWRKKLHTMGIEGGPEEILRTTVCKTTLNPEWETGDKPAPTISVKVVTGSFEKKMLDAKEKWYEFQGITKGKREETRNKHDLKIIGEHDEIKVSFGDPAKMPVNVYLGDTIFEFKNKLREACLKSAEKETTAQGKEQFTSVKLTSNHYVMVFVPSEALRTKRTQGGNDFYKHWKMEYEDPGAWVPLDPLRTFNHYVMTHGFGMVTRDGKKNPLQLRVSFGSEEYERRNHRFRNFKKENADRESRIEEKNEAKTCFGFAKYLHKEDGSVEWRPVLVTRPEDYSEANRKYQVEWVFTPSLSAATELIDEDKVVLAPANPQIRGAGSLEHMEILMQAKKLHDEGLDDDAVTSRLNEILMRKYERQKKAEEDRGVKDVIPKPVPISAMDVKYFLASRNVEAEAQGMEMISPEPSEAGMSSAALGGGGGPGAGLGALQQSAGGPPGAGTGLRS